MPLARIPRDLRLLPFRGSEAVRSGVLTWARLRGPGWRRLFPDIYVTSEVELDYRLWCTAATIYAGPRAVISGLSAAYLWGVDLLPRDAPVEVTMPPDMFLRPRPPRLVVTRSRLSPADHTVFGRSPLTSPERTAFDVARHLPRVEAVVALDALLRRRVVTLAALSRHLTTLSATRGARRFGVALALVEPLAESPMESRLRLVLIDGGLPTPSAQVEVFDADGRLIGRVDLAYPARRVGIEYEGDHHRERVTFRRDIARVNAMTAAGWTIVRVTADDVFRHPEQLVQRIRRLLALYEP